MKKRFVALFITILMLLPNITINAETYIAEFSVKERNGQNVNACLIRRGFPLKQGTLYENEDVCVMSSDGIIVPTQTRVLEKYSDGSIKWIMAAISVNLAPNETQSYRIVKSRCNHNDINVVILNNKIQVNNDVMTVEFDNKGINSIFCNNREYLSQGGEISFCKQKSKLYSSDGIDIAVKENGCVYTTIEVTGKYTGSAFTYKKTYTIVRNSNNISCSVTNISSTGTVLRGTNGGTDTLNSLFDKFYLNTNYNQCSYDEKSITTSSGIVSGSFANCSENNNYPIAVAIKKIGDFQYAFSAAPTNGIYYNSEEKSLTVAPIIYEGSVEWMDGMSRTVSYDIVLGKVEEQYIKYMNNTPQVIIPAQQYVNAGLLASTDISPVARAQINEIKWLKDKRGGRINAGTIPYTMNSEVNSTGLFYRMTGEMDVNTWYAVMSTSDADLFDIAYESSLTWNDCAVYRGYVKNAHGIGRFRFDYSMAQGHCYYGEFTNLYIAYLMTGDLYFYDTIKLMANKMYDAAMAATTGGTHMVHSQSWADNTPRYLTANEIRDALMIQAMQNSANLLEDERYSFVASEMVKWLQVAQRDDGSFAQTYNMDIQPIETFNPSYDIYKVLYKNYLMLYGMRGPCRYYDMTKDKEVLDVLIRFGNYLISEIGDKGWMYDPCEDKTKCETGEDGSRGKAPMQEMMAIEVFDTLYRATGSEKYFKALCETLQNYIASSYKTGFSATRFNESGYQDGTIGSINSGQNTTLMKIDSELCRLFRENRSLAEKIGYRNLADVFTSDAAMVPNGVTNKYYYREVSANLYETAGGRYLFIGNNSGYNGNYWDKIVSIPINNGHRLMKNVNTVISRSELSAEVFLKQFDTVCAWEIPIEISDISDKISFNVKEYTNESIVVECVGKGSASVTVEDGDFEVSENNTYLLSRQCTPGKTTVVIKKNYSASNITAQNNKLNFNITVN